MKKVLNVGGNSKAIPLPPQYAGFEHLLLDIDPTGNPDVLCDARELTKLDAEQFDMVYCSHNLEHYYRHDVPRVLNGFFNVLKTGGAVHIIVPDLLEVMKKVVQNNMDIDDVLYQSGMGPIMVSDVIYGYSKQIEASGVEFFAHKTGFTKKSLVLALTKAGFKNIHVSEGGYSVTALASKGDFNQDISEIFGLK